ncbi:MAG: M23 family metallopeptidase [Clostridia bacterium]|jgi:hypothetical protein|nr:M23 family metallopeptidase [Clostridia bacterium]
MNQELDYAEMLEIPVSTVNVVKKKSIFKHRAKKTQPPRQEDLKELVVDSVNERVGAFTYTEDLSELPVEENPQPVRAVSDKGSKIIITELVAVCVLAVAIFLTNVFMPTSVINTFISSLANRQPAAVEPTYSEIKLSPVVSELAEADVTVTDSGVLCFTAKSSVYPVCSGTVSAITESEGLYTVQIKHTSSFSSVITGLSSVYSAKGTKVQANIPFAYSDGENEVRVSMYDGETLLNCYTLSEEEVPVWNS